MAGKKNTEKEGSSWVGGIEKYSRQIWLAGVGFFLQKPEGRRVGERGRTWGCADPYKKKILHEH